MWSNRLRKSWNKKQNAAHVYTRSAEVAEERGWEAWQCVSAAVPMQMGISAVLSFFLHFPSMF